MRRACVVVVVMLAAPWASALGCPRILTDLTRNFRRKFNEGVLVQHQIFSQVSFAEGFDATKRDLWWSRRFHEAVAWLDDHYPGWDTSDEVKMIATAHEIPLITEGVFPELFPKHTLVLIRERDGVPVAAVTLGESPAAPLGRLLQ